MWKSKTISKEMHEQTQNEIQKTHELFCLQDVDAVGFGLPQPAINAAMFIRELESVFKNPDHPITKYPDKFRIYRVGGFNYHHGQILPSLPEFVGLVSDFQSKIAPPEPIQNRP